MSTTITCFSGMIPLASFCHNCRWALLSILYVKKLMHRIFCTGSHSQESRKIQGSESLKFTPHCLLSPIMLKEMHGLLSKMELSKFKHTICCRSEGFYRATKSLDTIKANFKDIKQICSRSYNCSRITGKYDITDWPCLYTSILASTKGISRERNPTNAISTSLVLRCCFFAFSFIPWHHSNQKWKDAMPNLEHTWTLWFRTLEINSNL